MPVDLRHRFRMPSQPFDMYPLFNMFRTACRAAGIRKSAHGLRKYSATAYAEDGLSDAELEAIFGWVRGSAMAAHYSRNAERQRLSEGAAEKIRNTKRPNLDGERPNPKKDVV
jgi:integrase